MDFYYATDRESEKFATLSERVLTDAKKYSFHYKDIQLFIIFVCVNAIQDINKTVNHYIVFNDYGWAIILDMPNFLEVKYIFVYPENRRKGFFTQLLTLLKRQKKKNYSLHPRINHAKSFSSKRLPIKRTFPEWDRIKIYSECLK